MPWHRIVRADGSLAQGRRQRRLLEREGVPFRGERVVMRVARLPAGAIVEPPAVARRDLGPARAAAARGRAAAFISSPREILGGVPELAEIGVGMLHLLIRHTSASLALNENASPDVRRDFESWFSRAVPERRRVLDPHARG